jgi:hypothetical protein
MKLLTSLLEDSMKKNISVSFLEDVLGVAL